MNRTRQLRRAHARIFGIGLGLSILAHAAALALVRFDLSARQARVRMIGIQPASPIWSERTVRLVRLDEATPEPQNPPSFTSASVGGADAAAARATGGSSTVPDRTTGALPLPASSTPGAGFDRLRVVDPRMNVVGEAVSFSELPVAVMTAVVAAANDDAQPYVPGSIGKAKRQWAGAAEGDRDAGPGRGRFVLVPGDGHCPMPGRGGRGPFWTDT